MKRRVLAISASLLACCSRSRHGRRARAGRQARHPDDPRRRARPADQPAPLRALCRAPRPLHLRRDVGRPQIDDPEHPRHSQRHRRRPPQDQDPQPALAGRLLCRPIPLAGRRRPGGEAAAASQHPLGRGRRGQQLRHPRVPRSLRADRRRSLRRRQRRQRLAAGDGGLDRVHDLRRRQRPGQAAPGQRPRSSPGRSPSSASATRTGAAAAT